MNEKVKKTKGITHKGKLNEKLTIQDYITMALMLVLVYIVYIVIGLPIGLTIIGNLFMQAACSLVWGTLFLLLYTKVNKKWTVLIFGIILALMQLMNFWPLTVFLALGGVIGEIIWQKMDRTKFRTMTMCFTVQITSWFLGIAVPLMLIVDLNKYFAESYVKIYVELKELFTGTFFIIGLVAVIGCSITGSLIGKQLLKKHFLKAGIV